MFIKQEECFMLCEYCHQPIPKNQMTCPHCGAANPNYEDEKPKNEEKNSTIINNNVTINVNAPEKNKKSPNVPQNEEQHSDNSDEIKLSAVCTIVTALATAIAYTSGLNHEVSFLLIFILFYIAEFIGNLLLFCAAKAFKASKFVSVLLCMVFMVIGCVSCNSHTESINESYDKTHDFQEFSSKSQRTTENYNKSQYSAKETKTTVQYETLPEKPQDGMTFAQLKKQRWGYKFLYTKCRDFDSLRPNKRYYEARWYDSDGNLIGKGLLNCQDEDDDTAILIGFTDYSK